MSANFVALTIPAALQNFPISMGQITMSDERWSFIVGATGKGKTSLLATYPKAVFGRLHWYSLRKRWHTVLVIDGQPHNVEVLAIDTKPDFEKIKRSGSYGLRND